MRCSAEAEADDAAPGVIGACCTTVVVVPPPPAPKRQQRDGDDSAADERGKEGGAEDRFHTSREVWRGALNDS